MNDGNIPMDDLLPTSDAAFEPVDSAAFFDSGSPFWEFSDMYKWKGRSLAFEWGYYAAMFECALKSGRAFMFPCDKLDEDQARVRAEAYGRDLTLTDKGQLIVGSHNA